MGQQNQPYPRGGQQRGGGGRDQRANEPRVQVPAEDTKKIIVDGDVELLVKWAEEIGKQLASRDVNLSTNQIRNVFGAVRQIQLRWDKPDSPTAEQAYRDAMLLRPKMAYFAVREQKGKGGSRGTDGMEILQSNLEPALVLVGENSQPHHDRFQRFVEYFEAIVAYHKKYGGRE